MLKPASYLFILLKGIVIGVANIIPGVSGGTMAVVLGIYDRLIEAIGGFLTDKDKRLSHFLFLFFIAIGAGVGLKGLAPVISYTLQYHNALTMLFFMGLITGSIPAVVKLSGVKKLSILDMVFLALGVGLVLILGASPESKDEIEASAGNASMLALFISGILAGGAMIVPGVSGSLVMVLLGAYPVVLYAVDKMDFKLLIVLAAGGGLGVLLFSILIRFLLQHAANATHSFIFGLVGASVIILFRGFPLGDFGWLWGLLIFVFGAVLAHASGLKSKAKS